MATRKRGAVVAPPIAADVAQESLHAPRLPNPSRPRMASATAMPLKRTRADGRLSVRACFGELRTALAEGWTIVQPIFARPLWTQADNSETAFNFVLRREASTRLVTVPQGRTVERFIRDQQLTVDYRR